jgi:hyperosmotically inducible protein
MVLQESAMSTYLVSPVSATALAVALLLLAPGCNQATAPAEATGMPPPSTTVGTEIDDSVLTGRIKSALLQDREINSFDLQVETRKGEVQLSGFVDSQVQVDRAAAVALAVTGVKSIQSRVGMKGPATTVGKAIDDAIVSAKVTAALLGDANVKSFDIAVLTRKGEVQLSGYVDNLGQVDRAIELARAVEGVSSVSNAMTIKQ